MIKAINNNKKQLLQLFINVVQLLISNIKKTRSKIGKIKILIKFIELILLLQIKLNSYKTARKIIIRNIGKTGLPK